ncbi:septum formation initiator family protein [Succinatimonas hippei]|uniref:septum formation initiator family protein n=1 Tax=Succinatimonas hippei TaxID=626938 RepID=UPI0020139C71|nr:septum formation initiator family protein [Succinatimonas hippei]MCL1603260.1 septum formation initiator family protein [Succinatimonas hippei]
MAMKVISFCLLIAISFLSYDIWAGRNGLKQYEEISANLLKAQQQSAKLQDRNQAVIDELNDLKQGNTAIEELARTELGLIREDETFFRILGDK